MKATEIREKLTKANEVVDKRVTTIANQEAKAAKILTQIRAKGWDETNPWCMQDTEVHHDCYWLICDYNRAVESVKDSNKKLQDLQRIAQGWSDKLQKQADLETTIATRMPEVFRTLRDQLAQEWTGYEIDERERMTSDRHTMDYREFNKKWSYSRREELDRPVESIIASQEREAEMFIVDLYNRVVAVTGNVTDWWSGIRFVGKALNGVVVGQNGIARVETILAGGYNIQRLHYRVLVHKHPTDESRR